MPASSSEIRVQFHEPAQLVGATVDTLIAEQHPARNAGRKILENSD